MSNIFGGLFGGSHPYNNLGQSNNSQSAMNNVGMAQQAQANYMRQQYNSMMNRPLWVFNGVHCNTAREMADIIWPSDCPEKTHFLLRFE